MSLGGVSKTQLVQKSATLAERAVGGTGRIMEIKKGIVNFLVLLITANMLSSQESKDDEDWSSIFPNVEISNEELLREIMEFDSVNKGYSKGTDRAIFIKARSLDSIKKYFITYVFDYYDMEFWTPINQVARLNDTLVFFSIEGNSDFTISKDFFLKMASERFPEAYKYYRQNENRWPLPASYHGVPIWYLTFQNGSLINKEISKD